MYGPLSSILHFLLVALRPPAGASKKAIRKAGAVTGGLGMLTLALAAVLIAVLQPRLPYPLLAAKITLPLWLLGFGGVVVGAFRLVLAVEPDQMSSGKRMGLGVLFGCGSLVLLFCLGLGVAAVLSWHP